MKQLKVGKTKIGGITGSYNGKFIRFSIYYGNLSMPPVDGEYIHLPSDKYRELLDQFLNSEEGKEFEKPSEEEINAACLAVLNKEVEKENARALQLEEIEASKESSEDQPKEKENTSSDHLIAMYKKQSNILTIAVIFLVLVVVIQMFLNIYLFVR